MAFYDNLLSPLGIGGETEEERRRREEEEAANAIPFKQTLITDPVTGKQTMKMEGDVRDFTSANPNTPTVSGPVAPEQMGPPRDAMMSQPNFFGELYNAKMNDLNKRIDQTVGIFKDPEAYARERFGLKPTQQPGQEPSVATPGFNPNAPQPGVPTGPTAPVAPQASELNQLPQGVSSAASLQPTEKPPMSMAAQEALRRQQPQTQTQTQPQATTATTAQGIMAGPPMSAAPEDAWMSKFQQAQQQKDTRALAALNNDTRAPDWIRSAAADELGNSILRQKQTQQADQKFNTIIQNNGRGFEKAMKDPSEEGSIFRAYLYGKLGLNELAKNEQEKLGAGENWQQVQVGDQTIAVKFGADGRARAGYYTSGDQAGQAVDSNTLLSAMGGRPLGKGASLSSEVYIDKTTGQRYRSGFDNSGRAALVNVQGGASYKGDPRNLEVQSIGTSIAKAEGVKAVDLRYTGPIAYTKAGAEFIGKFNAENGTNLGYASQTPGAPLIDRNTGQPVTPGSGGTIRATTTVTTTGGGGTTTSTAGGAKTDTTGKAPVEIAAVNKVKAEQGAKDQKNQFYADSTYGLIQSIDQEIRKSTGSGIGAGVDTVAGLLGQGTKGAEAIAKLEILSGPILNNVPRFEGPQSNKDVEEYRRQAGDFANPSKPVSVRLAALDAMITILKKYDKEGKNDWSFGQGGEVDTNNPLLKKKK